MAAAALKELPSVDGVIAAAAVMDYRVETPATGKLKRAAEAVSLALVPSVDVLGALREAATKQWFMGFAAETDDVEANGLKKLRRQAARFPVRQSASPKQGENLATGFSVTTNGGTLFGQGWFGNRLAGAVEVRIGESDLGSPTAIVVSASTIGCFANYL